MVIYLIKGNKYSTNLQVGHMELFLFPNKILTQKIFGLWATCDWQSKLFLQMKKHLESRKWQMHMGKERKKQENVVKNWVYLIFC